MLLLALLGCPESIDYAVGVGAVYTTRCSAEMEATGSEYKARCDPPACAINFSDAGISHVAVALDPGVKVVGYAERTCLQDLSKLTQVTP